MGVIVVGVDGSAGSADALRWALDHAAALASRVVAVRVWAYPIVPFGIPGPYAGDLEQGCGAALAEDVAGVTTHGSWEGVEIEQRTGEGSAAFVLIDQARQLEADLLVVGTRGHGGFTGLVLGSVSATLAHHAPCPLLIIPPRDRSVVGTDEGRT